MAKRVRTAFLITSMGGGGAEKAVAQIASGLVTAGLEVVLIVNRFEGPNTVLVSKDIPVFELRARRLRTAIPALTRVLRQVQPDVLVANLWEVNVLAVVANMVANILHSTRSRVIVCEHSAISAHCGIVLNPVLRWSYGRADAIVAVSWGMASEMRDILHVPAEKISVIYNPVIDPSFTRRLEETCDHPWIQRKQTPILLAVGRLSRVKRFDLFLEAVARVRSSIDVRGIILGEGPLRPALQKLRHDLGLDDVVDMPGYVDNPLPFMKHADVFVQTSDYEGLPTVLIEAAACGLPSVVTDNSHGTREVVAAGASAIIVPRNDPQRLSEAIIKSLLGCQKVNPSLVEKIRELFGYEEALNRWKDLIDTVARGGLTM